MGFASYVRILYLEKINTMEHPIVNQILDGKVVDSKVIDGKTFIIIEKSTGSGVFYYEVELADA